ncbi:hypothetical protein J3R83DRAFT_9760, partial [Lanmaoa asiatica]
NSSSSSSFPFPSPSNTSDSLSSFIINSSSPDLPTLALITDYHEQIMALEDEVTKAHVLQTHPPSIRIPQLALLDEW